MIDGKIIKIENMGDWTPGLHYAKVALSHWAILPSNTIIGYNLKNILNTLNIIVIALIVLFLVLTTFCAKHSILNIKKMPN